MPDVTVEVEIYCGTCGEGLCNQSASGETNRRGAPFISVDACPKCMAAAEERGYDKGYEDAQKEKDEENDS